MNWQSPMWTVLYNIANGTRYVGTGWEFFDTREEAAACYKRQQDAGNYPTMRPFYETVDVPHMGAVHRYWYEKSKAETTQETN